MIALYKDFGVVKDVSEPILPLLTTLKPHGGHFEFPEASVTIDLSFENECAID